MHAIGGGIEKTPSTRDALVQHLLQLGCQAGHILDRHYLTINTYPVLQTSVGLGDIALIRDSVNGTATSK